MIANLKGIYETVEYENGMSIQLYDNTDYEAYPRHWHTCLEMIMPVEGSFSLEYDGMPVTLREEDILLIAPGALHSMEACPGKRYIFQADLSSATSLQSIETLLTILYPGVLITPEDYPDSYQKIHDLFTQIIREYHEAESLYEAAIYAALLQIMVFLRRGREGTQAPIGASHGKQKEYMDKFLGVCSYINNNCTRELTLEEVAAQAGFSKYHFSRLFKQFTNVSYYKYLNQKRIEHAEQLLAHSALSVTEISLSSGFSSLSAFIRMFKLLKGVTPSEYKKALRESAQVE